MRSDQRGVALAVVTVALVVTGALMVLAAALNPMRAERARHVAFDDRLSMVSDALIEFAMVNKRLPCVGDADGFEDCTRDAAGPVPWRELALPLSNEDDRIMYRPATGLSDSRSLLAAEAAAGEAFALLLDDSGQARSLSRNSLLAATKIQP
jgi:hypothetical protein